MAYTLGEALPPQIAGVTQGELELHIPAFCTSRAIKSALLPAARDVRIVPGWWGSSMRAEASTTAACSAAIVRPGILRTLKSSHHRPQNTIIFPLVTTAAAFSRYCQDAVRACPSSHLAAPAAAAHAADPTATPPQYRTH